MDIYEEMDPRIKKFDEKEKRQISQEGPKINKPFTNPSESIRCLSLFHPPTLFLFNYKYI